VAAFLLGCAGRQGYRGGEAGRLEVDRRRGDFSPRFRAANGGLVRDRSATRGKRIKKGGRGGCVGVL
jgi:hypothetical protein